MRNEAQEHRMRREDQTTGTSALRGKRPVHPRREMTQPPHTSFSTSFTFREQLGQVAMHSPCCSSSYKVQDEEKAYDEERKRVAAWARVGEALLLGNECQLVQKQLFVDYDDGHGAATAGIRNGGGLRERKSA